MKTTKMILLFIIMACCLELTDSTSKWFKAKEKVLTETKIDQTDVRAPLEMWVIYDHPKDHPDKFVVRRWEIHADGTSHPKEANTYDTLKECHSHIPRWTAQVQWPGQDPDKVIIEVWM